MTEMIKTRYKRALYAVVLFVMILFITAPMTAYAADNPLKISVNQVFTASQDTVDNKFSYKLRPLMSGYPMPHGSSEDGYDFTIEGTNSVQIGPINYTKQGLYKYEIFQQIRAEKPGYSYDKRVYTVEVHVDSSLAADVIVNNQDNTKANKIEFMNNHGVLPSDPNLMVDPPVKKTVFGNPEKNSAFIFRLAAQSPLNPMPPGSVNGIKTITITGSGEGEFGTWSYDKEGVYYYVISEVNSGETGYTYDTAVYTITDSVRIENGRLAVSRIVTNDTNKQVASLVFNNKYNSGGVPGQGEPKPDGPKIDGPKTGDDSNMSLYSVLLLIGGTLVMGALVYLILLSNRSGKTE
jgi:pilin isopeptide linkage protein